MGKPAVYTLQLQRKANGTLQVRLMLPGCEPIVMTPQSMSDVAAGIQALFEQTHDCLSMSEARYVDSLRRGNATADFEIAALKDRVAILEKKLAYGGAALSSLQSGLNNYANVTGGAKPT